MKKIIFIILIVLAFTACAASRGFDRGSLRSQIADQKVITEDDIKNVLALKPQLPAPFKLAIYFTPPKSVGRHWSPWNWSGEDKDALLAIGPELKKRNILADVFVIPETILEGRGNKAIRLAAARAGADAVLIINGISEVDRYNNVLGPLYILLVTAFFIPGTEADALVMVDASMWDVRNQYLYCSAEAQATVKETRPAFFIKENRIIKAAKEEAIALLKKDVAERLARIGTQ